MSYFNLFLSGNHLKIAKIRPPIDIFKCILNYDDRKIKLSFVLKYIRNSIIFQIYFQGKTIFMRYNFLD